ncbi:MAG: PQQ-dependent sugar dehydrogenase [Verrucomicrobia bacterium]|nr:PQQ-dependent sugar dehydrogenase [Verrucomicrobiota bacterium]
MKNTTVSLVLIAFLPLILNSQNKIGTGPILELYKQNCSACHGQNMEGGLGSSLIDDVWKYGSSDEDIAKVIREGVPAMGMIAWKDVLTEKQIRALIILMKEQKLLAESTGILEKVKPLGGVFSTEHHNFKLEKVTELDDILWSIAFLPDESILITQRSGKLWHLVDGKKTEITGMPKVRAVSQGGLLEVAPHPDYNKNGWIYLSFSEDVGAKIDDKPASMTAVVRGRIKNNKWVDEEEIFRAAPKFHTVKGGHYGSRFVFKDDYLFFSIGERQEGEPAQDLTLPNGKVHRLYHDGRVPEGNPFYNEPGAYKSIWSYGHRNPQGLDLHPVTGELWETEHGPRGGDELNIIRPGRNYGWPIITFGMNYNGTPWTDKTHMEGMEQPVHYWLPSIATCGIDFYEGNEFPEWKHNLLATGLSAEELQRLVIEDGKVIHIETILKKQGRVRDVASGPDGLIYVSINTRDPNHGTLYKMVPLGEPRWTSLFNGRDLSGWEVRDGTSTVLVDDGAMVAYHQGTSGHTYLTTKKTFSDFILELDVKVVGDLNSGILLRGVSNPRFRNGKVHGYQMEIDQSERQWTGGIYEEMGRGWLYSLEGKDDARKAYRPSDWNHYRIEAIGEHFRIWVNGVPTLNMADKKTTEGVIGFQIHNLPKGGGGGAVHIRNVRIVSEKAGDQIQGISIPEVEIEEASRVGDA